MEILLSDEFRLLYALLLQAAIIAGAWRFIARRLATDWADRATDVLLLCFLMQYLAVALPGLVGLLNPISIAITTIALSAALFFAPGNRTPLPPLAQAVQPQPQSQVPRGKGRVLDYRGLETAAPRPSFSWTLLAAVLFAAGYLTAVAWNQRYLPVISNDAITYHFPAAVQWLGTGRISLFETWFFNPANTYSPLAGSTFIAWWIAPLGNDVLARHAQVPALFLIFFAALRIMRAMGARTSIAALVALALILSKPFLRHAEIEKDDLYLAAFFACAVAGFTRDRLTGPLGPWRIGVALGLLLATKYTALLALPPLLLLIDAPRRARWPFRRYAIAVGVILLLAGPWYLRNWTITGNPLYPVQINLFGLKIFPGMMTTARSQEFSSPGHIWHLLTGVAQSLPPAPMLLLLIATIAALALRFRQLRTDPLLRLCLLGPIIALLVFLAASPYPEVRFLDPAFVLLFACAAVAITTCRQPHWLQTTLAAIVLLLACITAFPLDEDYMTLLGGLVAAGIFLAALGLFIAWILRFFPSRRREIIGFGSLALFLLAAAEIYTGWKAYIIKTCENSAIMYYAVPYGPMADVWKYIRETIPPTETLAYANTFLIHPMSGFNHLRPLVYIPTRRGVTHISDLPPFPQKLSGEEIRPAIAAALTADTDADTWLKRLRASGATHLVIYDHEATKNPPEKEIVKNHPDVFEQVFQNPSATIYRLRK